MNETTRSVGRLPAGQIPWWVYNGALVGVGALALAASLVLSPGDDPRWVYLPDGTRFGETCAFLAATGLPCPQCGMTRSWVFAARGHLIDSFLYSPGGLGLFLWSQVAGVFGAIRLALRRPHTLELPWQVFVGWCVAWMIGLYLLPYGLRLGGIDPLP
ncbi:MAG: DUF2752 domain-containing protein [Myxococcota bacterium]